VGYFHDQLKRQGSGNAAVRQRGVCSPYTAALRKPGYGLNAVAIQNSYQEASILGDQMAWRIPEFFMELAKTAGLFVLTALAEIVGCYLPYLWLQKGKSPWLLVPAAISLSLFAWLLTLHPTAAGRVYAAYGGVYITVALGWLWIVDGITPNLTDAVGVLLCLAGMSIIMFGPRWT
jgi:small multidrug resistance family-3 protein